MVIAFEALGVGDLATVDDEISRHRNLLARFMGNDAALHDVPSLENRRGLL
jgi:hypothetical protein